MVEVRVDVVGLDAPQRLTRPIKIGEEGRDLPPVLATSPIGGKKECPSGGSSVIMMETADDRERDDVALGGALRGDRGLLAESLVRARGVVVADVLTDDALEVPVIEHQDEVEAFATQRAEKALADGVHVGRVHRHADHPDARGAGERIEAGAELIVAIANQKPWRRTKRRRVAKLLRHPRLRGAACRRGEHDFAGVSSMKTNAKIGRKNTS